MRAVATERTGDIAIVRLTRPNALNAMNVALLDELPRALRDIADARVIVLEGEGRAFCVGEDLKESLTPAGGGADELRAALEQVQEVTRLLVEGRAIAIAAVQGYAVGGGAELALAADLVVAQRGARLRFPEVSLGHAVTGGITARLPAIVGLVRAKELLLRARWIEADEALALGLVNELVDDARARARELAAELAAFPPRSLAATKRALERAAIPHHGPVLDAEIDAALHCFAAPEAAESIAEFRERKR